MKNLIYLVLISSVIFIDSVSMEEGESPGKYKPASYIGGGKLGGQATKPLPQNIWTQITELGLINPFGKTEAEIFRITDLMMYPKKAKEPRAKDSESRAEIDLKKVQDQAGLRKALQSLIDKTGVEEGKKNYSYEQFKADVLNKILRDKLGTYPTLIDLFETVSKLKAYNWAKFKYTKQELFETSRHYLFDNDIDRLKKTLEFSSDPNFLVQIGNEELSLFHCFVDNVVTEGAEENLSIHKYIDTLAILLKYGADPLSVYKVNLSLNGKILHEPHDSIDSISFAIKEVEDKMGKIDKLKYYTGFYMPEVLKDLNEMKKMMDEAIKNQKQSKSKKVVTGKESKEEQD